jgi:hypothetical protein
MEVGTVLKLLDIMSRALPVLLALSGIIAFVFREWIKKWIEAHFRKTVDSELELLRSQLSESLEGKKATLAKELAIQTETLKAQLDWSPILRQTVKTHFSANGELSHGIVAQAVHAGV